MIPCLMSSAIILNEGLKGFVMCRPMVGHISSSSINIIMVRETHSAGQDKLLVTDSSNYLLFQIMSRLLAWIKTRILLLPNDYPVPRITSNCGRNVNISDVYDSHQQGFCQMGEVHVNARLSDWRSH